MILGNQRFDSFVVLAGMRTGSNYLEANLNAFPGICCYGEVFNPDFIGKKDQTDLLGVTLAAREADPFLLLRRIREKTDGIAGFRMFFDHDPRILAAVLSDTACAKIVLTRNPLESFISLRIARETGQWKLGDGTDLKTAKPRFSLRDFEAHLDQTAGFHAAVSAALQQTGQAAFRLDYDDLQDLAVLNGLARYLGVAGDLAAADGALKKQNPAPLRDKVSNPAEMEAALAKIDIFATGHLPVLEPRRTAGIPGIVAADDAGLLYLPMRGGPDAGIAGWLSALGPVSRDFNQKTLRQWKRARPGHRSFTVLRHPLARAHDAFETRVLSGDLPDLRALLARNYGVSLPGVGVDFSDFAAKRATFLGFLRFLKLNLSGQTGFRVDAHWASQSAQLQGFAQFQAPDHVLREDRLDHGLACLAAEVGVPCPTIPAPQTAALAALYDADLEAAARDAYSRDYLGFGFSNWHG